MTINFGLVLCIFYVCTATATDVDIKIGEYFFLNMNPNVKYTLNIAHIPKSVSYLYIQVHAHYINVTVSSTKTPQYSTSVTGHNVGMLAELKRRQSDMSWYLASPERKNITALIFVQALTADDPVPGGCNQEFALELDPNAHLSFSNQVVSIIYQWSNVGSSRPFYGYSGAPSCDRSSSRNQLSYDAYVFYLSGGNFHESEYFDKMKKIVTADDDFWDAQTSLLSQTNDLVTKSKFSISARVGQGTIYVIRVTQFASGSMIYVPQSSYGCNMTDTALNCGIEYNTSGKVLTVFALLIGVFLCFFGHRYFKAELIIFGLLALSFVSFILLNRYTQMSLPAQFGVSATIGAVGGVLWCGLWVCLGWPHISVIIPGWVGGYLFASVLFATPFGNISLWKNPTNYGLIFAVATGAFPTILIAFPKISNILTCTFVGSYLSLLIIDYYTYGQFSVLLLSSIYRAVDMKYLKASFVMPFTTTEICLSVAWACLFIGCAVFQFIRERKRPDFPSNSFSRNTERHSSQVATHIPINPPVANERTPLVPHSYQASPSAPPPPSYYTD